jgi:uncharacterized coiled-coil protein SlyX
MTREDVEARLTTLQTELERQMLQQRQLTDSLTQTQRTVERLVGAVSVLRELLADGAGPPPPDA